VAFLDEQEASAEKRQFLDDAQRKQYADYFEPAEAEIRDKRQLKGFKNANPAWRDSLSAKMYEQASNNPARNDVLALAFFSEDYGAAGQRQYGDEFDKAYRLPDGSLDQKLYKQDKFVLKMERAYHNNEGNIPLSWFVDNSADIDILEGIQQEIIQSLYQTGLAQQYRLAQDETDFEAFKIESQARGMGRREEDTDGLLTQTAQMTAAAVEELELRELNDSERNILEWVGDTASATWSGFSGWFSRERGSAASTQLNALGQVANSGALAVAEGNAGWIEPVANIATNRLASNAEQREFVRGRLGMTDEEFLMAGFPDALAYARALPELDPQAYAAFVAMAGGDEELAIDFAADAALHGGQNKEHLRRQRELYDADLRLQLHDLEDEDFTFGESVLDILGAYGNLVETIAVGGTLAALSIFEDGNWMIFDEQYFQDMKDYDTPASVLGIEGTIVGLLFNLTANGLADPANLVFSPAFRAGVGHIDDVGRMLARPSTTKGLEQAVDIQRGFRHDSIALQGMIDTMAATGTDELFMAGIRGFDDPLLGARAASKVWGQTADVPMSFFDNIATAGDDLATTVARLFSSRMVNLTLILA